MRMVFIRLGSKTIIIIIIISEDYLINGPDGNFSKRHGIYSTHAIRKHNIDEAGVEIQRENRVIVKGSRMRGKDNKT